MKRIKRLLSTFLSLIIVASMSIPVFAQQLPEEKPEFNEELLRQQYINYTGAEKVKYKNEEFCTFTIGNGKDVIILVPGMAQVAPIIQLKPFATELSKKGFKVVIIEPMGVGLSETTKKKRSIDNIVKELHGVIHQMGYKQDYSIMAHSSYGAYSLYYANKYKGEIKSFISLDGSVPRQKENQILSLAENMNLEYMKEIISSGQEIPEEMYLSDIWGYQYTEQDKYFMGEIFSNRLINENLFSESKEMEKNLNKIENMKFPCGYLGFVSEQNNVVYSAALKASNLDELNVAIGEAMTTYVPSESIREVEKNDLIDPNGWASIHLEVYENNERNKTYVVPSNHYVHYSEYWASMVEIIADWYNK